MRRSAIFLFLLLMSSTACLAADRDTLTVMGETTKGIQRLAGESSDLITTPFKIESGNILITLGVIGATSLTYIFDRDIQQKLQSQKGSGLDKAADRSE